MARPKKISLDNIEKPEVAICPHCGTFFVKTIKGVSFGFWRGSGIYCPVCETFVTKGGEKDEH